MTTAEDVLVVARSQLGVVENPPGSNRTPYGRWYGMDGEVWCAMFVSWVFAQAGLPLPASTSKGFAYTPSGAAWFRRNNKWLSNTSPEVRPGDVVFFHWPKMGRIAHVGIVEELKPNSDVVCIEGNTDEKGGRTGGRVMRHIRSRATVHPRGGFGRPEFAGGGDDVYVKLGSSIYQIVGGERLKIGSGSVGSRRWKALEQAGAKVVKVDSTHPLITEFPERKT